MWVDKIRGVLKRIVVNPISSFSTCAHFILVAIMCTGYIDALRDEPMQRIDSNTIFTGPFFRLFPMLHLVAWVLNNAMSLLPVHTCLSVLFLGLCSFAVFYMRIPGLVAYYAEGTSIETRVVIASALYLFQVALQLAMKCWHSPSKRTIISSKLVIWLIILNGVIYLKCSQCSQLALVFSTFFMTFVDETNYNASKESKEYIVEKHTTPGEEKTVGQTKRMVSIALSLLMMFVAFMTICDPELHSAESFKRPILDGLTLFGNTAQHGNDS